MSQLHRIIPKFSPRGFLDTADLNPLEFFENFIVNLPNSMNFKKFEKQFFNHLDLVEKI